MGIKFTKVDDLDKMFEKFAIDPEKLERDTVSADITTVDDKVIKEHLGQKDVSKEEKKIIK
ncbi:MAG: hypothetical protein LBD38_03605 [Streptococcaceae bacterium]|jgi:hypothetical protein|nr:hypothetical protein [Streptococcaceae bacterium]